MTHESPTHTLSMPRRSSSRPVPWPALLAAVAVPAALALATYPVRERLFTAVAGFAEGSALASAVASVAEFGLLALVATAGVLAVWCWLRARRRFWLLALAGLGVITAYGLSEAVKLLVEQPRPCSVVDTVTVLNCPGGGDWSWPSNHAILAARSEEHTSELQSRGHLVCRLLLEKKNHHQTESDDDGRKDNNQDRLTQASRADTSVQRRGLYHSPYDESALSDEHQ